MPNDNVHFLDCPVNVMHCTLAEVTDMVASGELTSLYVVGTAMVDGKDQIINAIIITKDTPFYTLLGGMKAAADNLSTSINANVQVFES